MNLSFANTGDPYLSINPAKIWAPYLELIIRAGIATRHPNDPNKIKLIEFHL